MFIKYILIILSSLSIICRLSHSPFVSPLSFTKVMGRRGGRLFEWGVAQGVGAYLGEFCLLEGKCFIWGNMICAGFCVVHIAFIISADFCLFLKSKKHMQKTLWHHLFPTFVQKQKQTCLWFAKSAVWDIYKVK